MPQYFKEHGEELVRRGYFIVPLPPGSKGPRMEKWPQARLTEEDVRRMAANGSAMAGIGILATNTPAIDVDILDKDVADQVSDEIDRIFGPGLWTRTGKAPKFLVPFRSDVPIRKMKSATYTDGKNEHKVEILGDGQQWVAYHIHPDTQRPYAWFDGCGDAGITDVEHASLPVLGRESAQSVIDAFERIAAERVKRGVWRAARLVPDSIQEREAPANDDPFATDAPPVTDLSRSQIEWLVHKGDSTDYEGWIDVGMRLHHQYAGGHEGFEIWDAWSANSHKYDADVMQTHWDSFGHRTDAPKTIRGLLEKHGQPPKPAPDLPTGATESDPFPFYPGDEYSLGFENVLEMVEDLLPEQGTGMVYGASQSGKTFWAMDIAFHVHNGTPWRDKEVKQGPVFYIAAEAGRGIRKRIAAYKAVNPDAVSPFFADTAPDLLNAVWVDRIKDSIRLRGGAALVVIDTMSASFTGDDSSQQETAVMVQNCSNLAKSLECLVLFVHHAKKDGGSWRGSGVLYNDNDVVIEVSADGEGATRTHCAHVVKQRDDEAGQKYGFRLVKSGKLGRKPNGKPITSCTIEQTDDTPAAKTKKQGAGFEQDERYGKQRHYLDILAGLAGLGNDKVEAGRWIHAIQSDPLVNPEGEPDNPRADSLTRSFHRMSKHGKISIEGRYVRLLT